jgi:hypothetical protein
MSKYKWVCRLTVLVAVEENRKSREVAFTINKSFPFVPQLGLDVHFLGMPTEARLSQVCYVEEGNSFEVFIHIGDSELGIFYDKSILDNLVGHGWMRD